MSRYGVKYPNGMRSGPIADSFRAAADYAKSYRATVYEVGSREDPTPRNQPEAEPWDFGARRPDLIDVAEFQADIANDLDKCYGVSAKFGGGG